MIHKVVTLHGPYAFSDPMPPEVSYVISAQQVWRPGSYDSERTANYATRFSDEVLRRLQDEVIKTKGPGFCITYDDLQKVKV